MAFNNTITRTNAQSLIPEDVTREIFQEATQQSVIMRFGRPLPNIPRNQTRLPVLSVLPTAGFVNGDTGLKSTTKIEWQDKYLEVGEIAVIVPIPESVLADTAYDIWATARPLLIEEFARVFDAAVMFGTNAPSSWPNSIVAGATAASHTVTLGTGADVYDDILGESGIHALVEADGYMPMANVARVGMRSKIRGLRATDGQLLANDFNNTLGQVSYVTNGAWVDASAEMISGDFSKLVWAIRQDMTFKIFTEGVVNDAAGNIIYNLMQQDMVALRAVMRIAWQIPNPVTRLQATEANRYPFAVLLPSS